MNAHTSYLQQCPIYIYNNEVILIKTEPKELTVRSSVASYDRTGDKLHFIIRLNILSCL